MQLLYSAIISLFLFSSTFGQMTVSSGALTPTQYVENIVGPGVTISNVTFTGNVSQIGTYGGTSNIGFPSGVVLSSGSTTELVGPASTATAGQINVSAVSNTMNKRVITKLAHQIEFPNDDMLPNASSRAGKSALFLFAFSLSASAWQPKDTVQLVIPFPPGGSTDVIGRIVAEGLRSQGVSNILVVNRPGAGGVIGTNSVIEDKADGHTILLTGTSFLFNRLQNTPGANYDLTKSLTHIGLIGTVPNHLYSRKGLDQVSLKEIIKQTKQGKSYSWGVTNPGAEFTAQLIEAQLGVKLNIIPYKGSAPAITD
jgi:hypothetical protein